MLTTLPITIRLKTVNVLEKVGKLFIFIFI